MMTNLPKEEVFTEVAGRKAEVNIKYKGRYIIISISLKSITVLLCDLSTMNEKEMPCKGVRCRVKA